MQYANAAIYAIEAPFMSWLWPLLAVMGLGIQLSCLWRKSLAPLFIGLIPILICSWADGDPTLLAGDLMGVCGLFIWIRQKSKNKP